MQAKTFLDYEHMSFGLPHPSILDPSSPASTTRSYSKQSVADVVREAYIQGVSAGYSMRLVFFAARSGRIFAAEGRTKEVVFLAQW